MSTEILCDECGEPAGLGPVLEFMIDPDSLQVVCLGCLPPDEQEAHDEEVRDLIAVDEDEC